MKRVATSQVPRIPKTGTFGEIREPFFANMRSEQRMGEVSHKTSHSSHDIEICPISSARHVVSPSASYPRHPLNLPCFSWMFSSGSRSEQRVSMMKQGAREREEEASK
jgi:hypothetical protein